MSDGSAFHQYLGTGASSCAPPLFYILIFTGEGYSTVAQKYLDAIPCFSHDIQATLSIKCKYISFYPNVPCLNAILTNSMQFITIC